MLTDEQREAEIDAAALELMTAKTRKARRAAWKRMRELIAGRSLAARNRLAAERGLPLECMDAGAGNYAGTGRRGSARGETREEGRCIEEL